MAALSKSVASLSIHTGAHYDARGGSIDATPLNAYIGACRVIDCSGVTQFAPQHLAHALSSLPPRVLLRTYATAPQTAWDAGFASVAAETITLLAQREAVT